MPLIGCSEFRTESAYGRVPSETRVCGLPFTCKIATADVKDAEKEQPGKQDADAGMGVSIVLAKGFKAQHSFGLTHNICARAVSVKGFAFGDLLLSNLQRPGKLETARGT